jgi:glyoxylase-like metal-dependent hydrolase (beta-lactamase superfamily II)
VELTREPVHDRIELIGGPDGGRFPRTYALLIRDEVTALIDAGCGREALDQLRQEHDPEVVILSHAHPDHCSGAGVFDPEVLWSPEEHQESTGDLQRMARRFVAPEIEEAWIEYMNDVVGFVPFTVGHHFVAGHVFDLGQTLVQAVHAPGHTDDHYCFHLPRERLLLTTDIDFTSFGPWYGNEESEIDLFVRSIERVRRLPVERLVSSHKGVVARNLQQHFDRYLAFFGEREQKILTYLDAPRTLEDFVEQALIYRRYPYRAPILRYWERQMIAKHLRRLMAADLVEQRGDSYMRVAG